MNPIKKNPLGKNDKICVHFTIDYVSNNLFLTDKNRCYAKHY